MKRRVLTLGTFDIPHAGHAAFLRQCARYGRLTVGVNSDAFVLAYKGVLPVFSQEERLALIRGLGYRVEINDGPGAALIEALRPDLVVVGSDWLRKDYLHQIGVAEAPCPILFVPYTDGISTSDIKRRLIEGRRSQD